MKVKIKFTVQTSTRWGDTIYVVGSVPELGSWNPYKAIRMSTNANTYPIWTSDYIEMIFRDSKLEYKYVNLKGDGEIWWEAGFSCKNRFIYAEMLKGLKTLSFIDGYFSAIDYTRRIEAYADTLPKEVKQGDSNIKLIGRNEEVLYVNMAEKSADYFCDIKIGYPAFTSLSLWIQARGCIFVTGGNRGNGILNTAYRCTYEIKNKSEGCEKIKSINFIYTAIAPMLKDRTSHRGVVVKDKYIYVIGGNNNNSAEKYDIDNDKWSYIPSNTKNYTRGSLTLLQNRYLLAIKQNFLGLNAPSEIHAERLDLLDEESGWEEVKLNFERCPFEPENMRICEAGYGRLSVLVSYTQRLPLIYLFDLPRNKIIKRHKLGYLGNNNGFVEYENGLVKWYFGAGIYWDSLLHKRVRSKALSYSHVPLTSEAYNYQVTRNIIHITQESIPS